jgi:signal transduction histidine kinase
MQESSDFPHELAVLEGYRISMLPGAAPLRMLYDIQEDVARRLALRLHDESAQALATASVELAEIATQCPEQIVSQLNTVVSRLEDVAEQLRRHSHELHPLILDRRGLMPALQLMACSVRARASLEVVVSGRTPEVPIKGQEIVLYRVVQEALANVVRHAGATEVRVLVDHDDSRIFCSVKDNGIGLKPSSSSAEVHGLGMVGIHERVAAVGGTCRIISSWGRGLELQVEIPL